MIGFWGVKNTNSLQMFWREKIGIFDTFLHFKHSLSRIFWILLMKVFGTVFKVLEKVCKALKILDNVFESLKKGFKLKISHISNIIQPFFWISKHYCKSLIWLKWGLCTFPIFAIDRVRKLFFRTVCKSFATVVLGGANWLMQAPSKVGWTVKLSE